MSKLDEEILEELEENTRLPLDHPSRQQWKDMVGWLTKGDAFIGSIKLMFESEDDRGVVATADIHEGDIILSIPKSRIITLRKAVL